MSRELQHAHTMNQFKEVCHGTNCNASKAVPSHSAECKAEHDLAYGIKPSYRHDNPLRELKILRAENASLKAELAEAKKDAERLKGLRELCGYVEDGSSQNIRITQDDATNNWIIRWNDKAGRVFSSSFKGAIDEAMKGK